MSIFKKLFAVLGGQQPTSERPTGDQYANMEVLRDRHEWIEVKLIRTDMTYQSMILNIDFDNSELLIDELFPSEPTLSLDAGERVEISSQSRKNSVSFFTNVLAKKLTDGKTSWLLELPTEIGDNINRSAFRIYVEREQELDIEMYYEGEPLTFVRIINLSTEGIKLNFDNVSENFLEKNHFFSDCLIRLSNDVDIDCDIDLRSVYSIRTPQPHVLAGGKLIINNPQQLVKLQQYLAAIQRRQQRGESQVLS